MGKKILHVIPALNIGGASSLVANLICAFDANRFEIGLCSLCADTGNQLSKKLKNAKLKLYFLNKTRGFDVRVIFRFWKIVKEFKPDVIHVHQRAIIYALLPTIVNKIPRRFETLHSVADWEGGWEAQLVRGWAYKYGGFIPIAVSHNVSESIARVYDISKSPVIHNGIPVIEYQAAVSGVEKSKNSKQISLIHVARLSPEKNHTLFIDSLKKVVGAKPGSVKAILVGDGPLRSSIKQLVQEQQLEQVVEFIEESQDVAGLLARADSLILTSNHEGLPLVVMEAMAAGKPVIATNVGGLPEIIINGKTGVLVPAADVNKLTEAIINLIDDLEHFKEMGQKAAEIANENFDISRVAREYEKLY